MALEFIGGYSMLPTAAIRRMAKVMVEGLAHHDRFEWLGGSEAGIPADKIFDRAMEHLVLFLQGDVTEDHLGHALARLAMLVHLAEYHPERFKNMPPRCQAAAKKWCDNKSQLDGADQEPESIDVPIGHGDPLVKCYVCRGRDHASKMMTMSTPAGDGKLQQIYFCGSSCRAQYTGTMSSYPQPSFMKPTPPAGVAAWLENLQGSTQCNDARLAAAAEEHHNQVTSHMLAHRDGWHAAFEYLIGSLVPPVTKK